LFVRKMKNKLVLNSNSETLPSSAKQAARFEIFVCFPEERRVSFLNQKVTAALNFLCWQL
ncbi:MAG: hypothetical protein ACI85F_002045, partial [Bacteroidia bacterium]